MIQITASPRTTLTEARSPWMTRRMTSARGVVTSSGGAAAACPVVIALLPARPGAVALGSGDRPHHLLLGDRVRVEAARVAPEAEHHDPVRHLEDVREVVAD